MVRKLEQYLADEARIAADDRNLVSRTEERRAKQRAEEELFELAERLASLKPQQLARLELADHILDIIDELRIIEDLSARNRATKRLRAELRDVDPKAFNQKIVEVTESRAPKIPDAISIWCDKLTGGTDVELNDFVQHCPDADRAQLRNLIRNVQRAKPNELKRCNEKLAQSVRIALRTAPTGPDTAQPRAETAPHGGESDGIT